MRISAVVRALAILSAACAGCYADFGDDGGVTSSADESGAVAVPPAPMPHIAVTLAGGREAIGARFDARDQVYAVAFLRPRVTPIHPGPDLTAPTNPATLMLPVTTASDYVFAVFDASGRLLSTDDLRCRRVRVDAHGAIDRVYDGRDPHDAACQHGVSSDRGPHGSGGLAVQLAPFAESTTSDRLGNGSYVVKMVAVGAGRPDFASAHLTAAFTVVPGAPCCGDGVVEGHEQCDDGNTTSGDGCSSTCTLE